MSEPRFPHFPVVDSRLELVPHSILQHQVFLWEIRVLCSGRWRERRQSFCGRLSKTPDELHRTRQGCIWSHRIGPYWELHGIESERIVQIKVVVPRLPCIVELEKPPHLVFTWYQP